MTVKELADKSGFIVYTMANEREIKDAYCCDLLSNALVKLKKDALWLTVVNNVNVGAVAYNNNISCVVLTEGTKPDRQLLDKAVEYKLSVLGTELDSYHASVVINRILF